MYKIVLRPSVNKKDLKKIPLDQQRIIKKIIQDKLTTHPVEFSKPLKYELSGSRRLRIGNYRVIFIIHDNIVTITVIEHRKTIY